MSFENRNLGGNVCKIHVLIREATHTIATLFTTRLNAARAGRTSEVREPRSGQPLNTYNIKQVQMK
jgi:hypothetical protein